ncbi:MAG: SDR family oxidoreductase [Sphingobacteriaceae bacterium]|nr:MAG: SDR family oxidoreductase [Sphingobacteriaceae bacterium]
MSKELEGKVVIVTGASKGIGAGIAKQMGLSGAKVVVNYLASKEGAELIVTEIHQAGGTAIAVQGDMSRQADVKRVFQETMTAFGGVHAVVNNAGVYEFSLLDDISEESYRRIFDINVWSLILTSQEAVKFFGENGGSIVNISSFASTRPEPYSLVYGASKSAADGITRSLSQELGPKKIRVNSINPGGILTEGVAKFGATAESEDIQMMIKRSALGRMATTDDIGKVAVFLASDRSEIVTGQTIEVSGGFK